MDSEPGSGEAWARQQAQAVAKGAAMETAIERAQIRAQNLLYAQRGCCCGGRPEPGEQWRAEHPLTPAQKQKIHFDVLVEDCLQYDDIVREREEKAYTEAYNKLRADVEDKVQVFRVEVCMLSPVHGVMPS